MTIRSAQKDNLRNPLIPAPLALPSEPRHKRGPGWVRPAAQLAVRDQFAGAQQVPLPNAQAQSARSNAAAFTPTQISRMDGTNARVLDRDSLIAQQDSISNYGRTQ